MVRVVMLTGLVVVTLIGSPEPTRAAVSVSIGIELPGPPALVPVPGTGVMYGPGVPANYFFHDGQYFVFVGRAWYASAGYDGPWVVVAPEFVPRAILTVPVRYYRVPPPEWRAWRPEAAPRWDARWGRRWTEHGRPPQAREHARRHEGHG